MNRFFKMFYVIFVIFITGISFISCASIQMNANDGIEETGIFVDWIAPMLLLVPESDIINLYNGTINVARANSDEGVRTGQVTTAGITEESLIANGAIKATAQLRYNGDDEFLVRFRIVIDEFSGHNIVNRRLSNATGENNDRVLVLWKDPDGIWWDLRRSALGVANTGGSVNRFILGNYNIIYLPAIKLDKNTAPDYESVDLYIVVLDPAMENDDVAGYIITYYAEMPDRYAGHFHGYEILVSTSTAITVISE